MPKSKQETTVVEDVIKAVSVPGSATRASIISGLETYMGRESSPDYQDIFMGRKEVTPSDLVNYIEDISGFDMTAGERNPMMNTGVENAANFGRDILVDIFTSPDSLISWPAKAAKIAPAFKALSKVKQKAIERGMVGATLGALSIQDDDDFLEAFGKISTGAGIGAGGSALIGTSRKAGLVGKAFEKVQETIVDPVVEKGSKAFRLAKDETKRTVKGFSQASKVSAEATSRIEKWKTLYKNETSKVYNEYADILKSKGLNDIQIDDKLKEFDEAIAVRFGDTIRIRNTAKKGLARRYDDLMRKKIAEDPKRADEITKGFTDNRQAYDEWAHSKATKIANNKVMLDMESKLNDPDLFTAIVEHTKKNDKLVDILKKETKAEFIPIKMHTIDFRNLSEAAGKDLGEELGIVTVGPKMRATSDVQTVSGAVTRDQAIELGANRYANLFLDKTEKEARQLLGDLYSSKVQGSVFETFKKFSKGEADGGEVLMATIDGYDKMLRYVKTKHLTTGTSWVMNNYVDNVIKAYVSRGIDPAVKVATGVPMQTLEALGNKLSAGALRRFTKKNTLEKFIKNFDIERGVAKIPYDERLLQAAADYGAIDSTKILDHLEMAQQAEGILKLKIGDDAVEEILNTAAARGKAGKALDAIQKKLWNTTGAYGSAIESSSRYILFKDAFDSLIDDYPDLSKYLKGKKGVDLDNRIGELLDKPTATGFKGKAYAQLNQALKSASAITNDTFFDYQNINAFERHIMKRIFPYWTFFAKNSQFWADKAFDPETVGRVSKAFTPIRAAGRRPTEKQRKGMPDYVLKKGARRYGRSKKGEDVMKFAPTFSALDPISALENISEEYRGRMSPLIEKPVSVAAGLIDPEGVGESIDPNIPVIPAEGVDKRIFESSIGLLPDSALKLLGIDRDKKTGALTTSSKVTAAALKLPEVTPFDPQFLDQIARAARDVRFRDKGVIEAIAEQASPIKETRISPKARRFQKRKRRREARKKLKARRKRK